MFFRTIYRSIQSNWRIILICVFLALMISLLISLNTVPQYRSTATFLIYPNANLTNSRDVATSLNTLEGVTIRGTYLEIFNSIRVFKDTVQKLQLDPSILNTYHSLAEVSTGSNITFSVTGPDPHVSAYLTNNIGQNAINYIKSIYQVFDISFLDQATDPVAPYKPNTVQDGGIAAGIGLILGVFFAFTKDAIRVPLEALKVRAITDKVSGAYNQRHMKRILEESIIQPDAFFSLGLIDLGGLEDLVDELPEAVLSGLLHDVTAIFHKQLRGNDLIGRWGRTSFALFLPSTPLAPATKTMERIKQALSDPLVIKQTNQQIQLSPSIGLATSKQNETASLVIDHASDALEKARQTEGNIVSYAEGNEG